MKKASLMASASLAALLAVTALPAFAQEGPAGPFQDVPTDHWAYSSVENLRRQGIVIGYPDGTYGGNRSMTRYEFAVAIARLLDQIRGGAGFDDGTTTGGPAVDLSNYYTKPEADAKFATKAELAGFATRQQVDELRRLVEGFQNELRQLGMDIADVRRRLDGLEGRVKAIEDELKRVKIGGQINLMARANTRNGDANSDTPGTGKGVIDQDGYRVTGGRNARGGILADTRVLHDIDLNVKARLSDTATAEAVINFGNYLPFLGSIGSYSGFRSTRLIPGLLPGEAPNGTAPSAPGQVQFANQDQANTIYKLAVEAPVKIPVLGAANISVGRIPVQLTPYTLKLIDVDQYFYNQKTDLGDIPMDGGKVLFNLGPVGVTAFGAKTDPIAFLSNYNGQGQTFNGNVAPGTFGLYAGASRSPYLNAFGGGFQGNSLGTTSDDGVAVGTGNRPVQSPIAPDRNGAMAVEQIAGTRLTFGSGTWGTIGGTYMVAAGQSSGAPVFLGANPSSATLAADQAAFDRVFVYGADANINLWGIGLTGSYTKSDTGGVRLNANGTINGDTEDKIDEDNYAWEAGLNANFGALSLGAGYRYIGLFFGAPGYWTRVGSYTNPVDIKGFFGNASYSFGRNLALVATGQFYEGTGENIAQGGLSEDDEIINGRIGFKFGATSALNVDLGVEYTQYRVLGRTAGGASLGRLKPEEIFYNIGFGYSFNPATSFKLLYQIVQYDDKGSGFDTQNGDGGVAAAQFAVKF